MIQKTLLMALLSFLFVLTYCDKNPTQPGSVQKPKPGQRNYVWELDTLDMPMNYIHSIWGASPNDVWAVGAGGTQYDRLMHYDGTKWSTYKKEIIWCSGMTLFGFSADNIWMGGGAGWLAHGAGIWHYNGVEWTQNYVYDIEGSHSIEVTDIWGTAPNDVFACGVISFYDGKTDVWRGFVLHYDGKIWREIVRAQFNSQFIRIRREQSKVFVLSYGINNESGDGDVEFYEIKGNQLKRIYSNKESQIHWASHNAIDGKIYFIIDQNIYRYLAGKMFKQFSVPYSKLQRQIWGRNEFYLFFPMKDGIVHYNGTDMEYIYNFPLEHMRIMGLPLIFEKEFFICIWHLPAAPKNNLILHGKLP